MTQQQAAQEAMVEWLAHPNELGKKPAAMEPAGEFDLHDLHYYIFKYKKSLLGKWLLGVCGGYEPGETEHCGHVFSAMQPYDPATAQEEAVKMVEAIREHWMKRAEEQIAKEGQGLTGPFAGFVLLTTPEWDLDVFQSALKADWGITCGEDAARAEGGNAALVFETDGMTVGAALMQAPIPGGEAEENAKSNFMWPGAVKAAKAHIAHIMLAVMKDGGTPRQRGELFVKLASTCLKAPNALGIYINGTVLAPDFYIQAAEDLRKGNLPLLDLVFAGLYRSEKGVCGYTNGLRAFGKEELEVIDSQQEPRDIHLLLLNVAGYLIEQDAELRDGETLGYTEDQKLPITRSPGVNMEGDTIKIQF